ncbi:hypothetical protein B0H14DRAFT_3462867 [Mycena olivaceomarginata]|nr:hypothetical protein B0H14DRAFT_3462867 [Mycena olivaceomarginata]
MATLCAIVFVAAAMLHVQDPGSLPQNVKISVYYMCAQFFYAVVWTIQISVMFNSSLLRGLMCGADVRAASWCEGVASWAMGAGCSLGVFSTVLPPFLLFVFSSFGEEYNADLPLPTDISTRKVSRTGTSSRRICSLIRWGI